MSSRQPGVASQGSPQNLSPDPCDPSPGPAQPTPSTMSYNCQPCVRRKVKCDRGVPGCTACVKSKQYCLYQAPSKPRRKKRKAPGDEPAGEHGADEDIHERLARYERILRENGLLTVSEGHTTPNAAEKEESPVEDTQPRWRPNQTRKSGKLLSAGGKSRYIDSNLWLETGAEDMQDLSDDMEGAHNVPGTASFSLTSGHDPISGALLGQFQDLLEFHPSHEHAMKLWEMHVQNAEPICRISHVPTTTKMVEAVSQQPSTATKAQECHLFAIYHFAVYTMTDDNCLREFGQSRNVLLPRYEHAQRQALVNASWLKTTEMPVLQALLLLLICGRGDIGRRTGIMSWLRCSLFSSSFNLQRRS